MAGLDLQLLGNDAIEFTVDPNREGTATFTFDAIITKLNYLEQHHLQLATVLG
jgi:hypothetical protein